MNFTQTIRMLSQYEGREVKVLLVPDGVALPKMEKDQVAEVFGVLQYVDFDTWIVRGKSYAKFKATDVTLLEEDVSLCIIASWGHKEVTYRAS